MRHFHSYGPVDPRFHYCVGRRPLIERCANQLVGQPGEGGPFFTIWAPRQTGKTWLMRQAMEEVRAQYGERFLVGTLSMQGAVFKKDDPPEAFLSWVPGLFYRGMEWTVPPTATWEAWSDLFLKGKGPFDRPLILLTRTCPGRTQFQWTARASQSPPWPSAPHRSLSRWHESVSR